MPEITAKNLRHMSPENLAMMSERYHPLSAEGVLIREEFERRRKPWHDTFIGKIVAGLIIFILSLLLGMLIGK